MKNKLRSFLVLVSLIIMGNQLIFAQGESVIYAPRKRTPITPDGVELVGFFPIGMVGVTTSEKNKITLGIENNSPYPFSFGTILVEGIFDGKYQISTNCPELLVAGEGCECDFIGKLRAVNEIDNSAYLVMGDTEKVIKKLAPWEKILPLERYFDFTKPYELLMKNVGIDDIEVTKVEISEGIYGDDPNAILDSLKAQECKNITPNQKCKISIPAQSHPTDYRTLVVTYKYVGQEEEKNSIIGLTNIANSNGLGIMNHLYNNLGYYATVGVVIVTSATWYYYLHREIAGLAIAVAGLAKQPRQLGRIGEIGGPIHNELRMPPPPPLPPPPGSLKVVTLPQPPVRGDDPMLRELAQRLGAGVTTPGGTFKTSSVLKPAGERIDAVRHVMGVRALNKRPTSSPGNTLKRKQKSSLAGQDEQPPSTPMSGKKKGKQVERTEVPDSP